MGLAGITRTIARSMLMVYSDPWSFMGRYSHQISVAYRLMFALDLI